MQLVALTMIVIRFRSRLLPKLPPRFRLKHNSRKLCFVFSAFVRGSLADRSQPLDQTRPAGNEGNLHL